MTRNATDQNAQEQRESSRPRHGLIGSFYFAFAGLAFLFRSQRNARIHLALGIVACGLGFWLRITRVEWALLVSAIIGVMILEGLNTAIEAAVDLACPDIHPLAKHAKDLAAGMVLLAAIGAIILGLLILGPPLWEKLI